MHNFKSSLKKGKRIETQLDEIFSKWYQISNVSLEEEKIFGYDRIFFRDDKRYTVEYKADWWLAKTGNMFVEYEVNKKPGWAIKTTADIIAYASVVNDFVSKIFIIENEYLKSNIDFFRSFPERTIQNTGFYGKGNLVPISELNVSVINVRN